MKRNSLLFAVAFLALVALSQTGAQAVGTSFFDRFSAEGKQTGDSGEYHFDKPHSFIGFKIRHLGLIEVPGFFRDFTGTVNYDANDITRSTVEFVAKTTSIDTGVARAISIFEVPISLKSRNIPIWSSRAPRSRRKARI